MYLNITMSNLIEMKRTELLNLCRTNNIKGYSSKTKSELVQMLTNVVPYVPPPPIIVPPMPADSKFKFIDLFCGVGGFHQALDKLGGHCVFASDIDEHCRNIYEKNYGLRPHGDITKVDPKTIPDFDILTGGFPCQSFSHSGKKGGFGDKRGQLYENILDIASEKKPSFMFLENVKHIKKIDNGEVFKHIISCIQNTGYHVETVELSPHQLGIPQQRERVVFICIRNDIYDETKKLDMTPPNTPIDFDKIIETDKEKTEKYKISVEHEEILTIWDEMVNAFDVGQIMSPTIMCNEFLKEYSAEEFVKLAQWKQDYITKNKPIYQKYKETWDAWYEKHQSKLSKREIYGKLEWQAGPKKDNDSIFNHFIQLRQSGIRVKKSKYFPTLVAIVQTPIYAKERRHITPRECARLQSFPDSFELHEKDQVAYKQFGNAVNVDVVHFVMSRVLKTYSYV
jgi:DNA (cytosine-5)-methyltransferase 1